MTRRTKAPHHFSEYNYEGIDREIATTDYSRFSQFRKITLPRLKFLEKPLDE